MMDKKNIEFMKKEEVKFQKRRMTCVRDGNEIDEIRYKNPSLYQELIDNLSKEEQAEIKALIIQAFMLGEEINVLWSKINQSERQEKSKLSEKEQEEYESYLNEERYNIWKIIQEKQDQQINLYNDYNPIFKKVLERIKTKKPKNEKDKKN